MSDQPKPAGDAFVPDTDSFVPEADQRELASDALDNAIAALGQCQKGTARQFLHSAINAAIAAEREKQRKEMEAVTMNTSDIETVQQLREQLVAEREQHRKELREYESALSDWQGATVSSSLKQMEKPNTC